METSESGNSIKIKWFSVKEAADYLDVGEPTLYRWIKDGKITYRKVGDSTRFLQEDLDAMVEVFHRIKDADKAVELCAICRSPDLVEGVIQSTGLNHFRPSKMKFWTLKDGNVETKVRMCARCGGILWYGDVAKLAALRVPEQAKDAGPAQATPPKQP